MVKTLFIACSKDKNIKIYLLEEKIVIKEIDYTVKTSTPTKVINGYDDKNVIVSYANGNIYTSNYLKINFFSNNWNKKPIYYLGDSSTLVFENNYGI